MNNACQTEIRELKGWLTKAWAALVVLALAAVLTVACNGGEEGGGLTTVQPTVEGSATVQPTAEGSPTVQPTAQVATSAACQALASLKSYRYVSNVKLESPEPTAPPPEGQPTPVATLTRQFTGPFYFEYNVDASLITPDRVEAVITVGGAEPFNMIVIGDRRWISQTGEWQEAPEAAEVPYKPLDICNGVFPELNLEQAQGEKETVNEVSARHYAFPAMPSGQAMATIFGAESDMAILFQTMDVEVWVAEKGGWPMRMDIQGSGLYADGRELRAHIGIELRDINDKDIRIEPPS